MKIGIKASYMDLLDKQKIKNLHKEKIKPRHIAITIRIFAGF